MPKLPNREGCVCVCVRAWGGGGGEGGVGRRLTSQLFSDTIVKMVCFESMATILVSDI